MIDAARSIPRQVEGNVRERVANHALNKVVRGSRDQELDWYSWQQDPQHKYKKKKANAKTREKVS